MWPWLRAFRNFHHQFSHTNTLMASHAGLLPSRVHGTQKQAKKKKPLEYPKTRPQLRMLQWKLFTFLDLNQLSLSIFFFFLDQQHPFIFLKHPNAPKTVGLTRGMLLYKIDQFRSLPYTQKRKKNRLLCPFGTMLLPLDLCFRGFVDQKKTDCMCTSILVSFCEFHTFNFRNTVYTIGHICRLGTLFQFKHIQFSTSVLSKLHFSSPPSNRKQKQQQQQQQQLVASNYNVNNSNIIKVAK